MLQKKRSNGFLRSENSASDKLLSNDRAIVFSGALMLDAGFAIAMARIPYRPGARFFQWRW
jgi:hypothetical protein